jgi:hypothetical protein
MWDWADCLKANNQDPSSDWKDVIQALHHFTHIVRTTEGTNNITCIHEPVTKPFDISTIVVLGDFSYFETDVAFHPGKIYFPQPSREGGKQVVPHGNVLMTFSISISGPEKLLL